MTIRKFDDLQKLRALRGLLGKPSEDLTIFSNLITLIEEELRGDNQTKTHIYVDGENGDDVDGDGSESNPFATIGKAMEFVPTLLNGDYIVHIVSAGTYTAPTLEREFFCGGYRLAIVGEAFEVIDSGTVTDFTNTNSNPWLIEDDTQAWSADEHIVRFVRFTSGNAAGKILNVVENDGTTIRTVGGDAGAEFEPVVGDTFEIVRPSVILDGFNGLGGTADLPDTIPFVTSTAFATDRGGVTLVNVRIDSNLVGTASTGYLRVHAVLVDGGIVFGTLAAGVPGNLTWLDAPDVITDGLGAGLVHPGQMALHGDFVGVINAGSIFYLDESGNTYGRTIEIISGRIWSGNAVQGSLLASYERFIKIGTFFSSAADYGRLLIKPALGETVDIGVVVARGGHVHLRENAVIECTDAGSIGLLVTGIAKALVEGTSIDGATRGIQALGGAHVELKDNGANITVGGSNTNAVDAGGTLGSTGAGGAFASNFDFLAAASGDGSRINRVD